MWQPRSAQWWLIVGVALAVVLGWPPSEGKSLGAKIVNWAVDPGGSLPMLPDPLPPGLDDNGDAVTEHDQQVTAYYDRFNSSAFTRWRMTMKEAGDPWPAGTGRQVLVGVVVFGALAVWRLNGAE